MTQTNQTCSLSGKLSSDGERFVSNEFFLIRPEEQAPPKSATLLLLTKYGKLVIGKWNDEDCEEWAPLPRRSKHRKG